MHQISVDWKDRPKSEDYSEFMFRAYLIVACEQRESDFLGCERLCDQTSHCCSVGTKTKVAKNSGYVQSQIELDLLDVKTHITVNYDLPTDVSVDNDG